MAKNVGQRLCRFAYSGHQGKITQPTTYLFDYTVTEFCDHLKIEASNTPLSEVYFVFNFSRAKNNYLVRYASMGVFYMFR